MLDELMTDELAKAKRSLEGLAMGDAFGELFFSISPHTTPPSALPKRMWRWTDDTHMAVSIVEVLKTHGHINQDALAQAFAKRYQTEPHRGYAGGAEWLLQQILDGADWRRAAPALFDGGSYGNGAAMRVAPVGAYFCKNLPRAAQEAQRSAVVTHAHPEGQAGAIAVAVAAAIAAGSPHPVGREFLMEVLSLVPDGMTKQRLEAALEIPRDASSDAVQVLGSGSEITAQDTVPFCLWVAAHHLDNFEEALWTTAKGMGDRDTTCAIVGGIVSLAGSGIPASWLEQREPLPIV